MHELLDKGLSSLRERGVGGTLGRVANSLTERIGRRADRVDCARYAQWLRRYDTLSEEGRRRVRGRLDALKYRPLISVLMPVYETPEVWLRRAVESVLRQLYTDWELCIADDASARPHVRPTLEEYAAADARVKLVFRERNGHISAASNSALALAAGEFVALLDHDDELHELALYHVASELNAHPEACLLYSDEDTIDAKGRRYFPHFKPDWSPDLFLSQNFINHLTVYRTQTVREACGFAEGLEGSQDYDLALRVTERIPASQIRHIPRVLYHWRAIRGSTSLAAAEKSYVAGAAQRALASHLCRVGREAEVLRVGENHQYRVKYRPPARAPKVHLIVSAPGRTLLNESLSRLASATNYPDYEVTFLCPSAEAGRVLPSPDSPDAAARACRLAGGDASNEARSLNRAARAGEGELLLFLDGALSPDSCDWLAEMVSHAVRAEVGAVGAMLLDDRGKILDGGLLLGVGERGSAKVAGGALHGLSAEHTRARRFGRSRLVQNFSAVAKSCLMIRRELFEESGGFDESNLPRAFYDVDLCLRLRGRGRRVLFTPFAALRLRSGRQRPRAYYNAPASAESDYMHRRWGALLRDDPCYNPNLDLTRGRYDLAFPPRVEELV
jgi:GT2 family glycosyltransferase